MYINRASGSGNALAQTDATLEHVHELTDKGRAIKRLVV